MKQISSGPTPTPFPSGGSPGQVLGLDGAGKLAWLTVTGGGGGGTPPGAVGYSQYRLNVTAASGADLISLAELRLLNDQGANIATGGTASASSEKAAYLNAAKAFDGDPATGWSTDGLIFAGTLTYALPTPSAISSYSITAVDFDGSRAPKTFTLEGSNDGSSWTILHTVADAGAWAAGQSKTYTI